MSVLAEGENRYWWRAGSVDRSRSENELRGATVRVNQEVQGLPVVAQDLGDEQAQEAISSSNQLVWPVADPQSEQQENHGD